MPWHRRTKTNKDTEPRRRDNHQMPTSNRRRGTPSSKSHLIPRLILFFGGIFVILFTFGVQQTETKIVNWPRVDAKVLTAEIEEIRNTDRADLFRLHVSFSYQVDSKSYKSTRLSPYGFQTNSRPVADKERESFAPGSSHKAYVNPDDPADAYLRVYGSRLTYNIFIGIGMVMIGLAAVVGLFRR
ncbi:hypothetical protein TRICHSKD4_2137 [Roseibium sp. TrichSKD4]|uniref:DUF3592 domain-containing protein n=1 Tax=Roseibium sp. TrichSKD4 TaxID=744980 RepID=UPI0001E570E2|nr:hypothetical protein TRICHSKD4_2137 [Roseibium sp. TrichSKD4]